MVYIPGATHIFLHMGKGPTRRPLNTGIDMTKFGDQFDKIKDLKKGGYAPGDHRVRCQRCLDWFDGDKRAYRCKQCTTDVSS